MNLRTPGGSELRFSAYVEGLVSVIGHADRAVPLRDYCLGLMMPSGRKSVEPMAAITRAGSNGGAASVTFAFRRQRSLVGREGFRQGARDGAACNRTARAD